MFLGIVTRKCVFGKICAWLSNSNRIACVLNISLSALILMSELINT